MSPLDERRLDALLESFRGKTIAVVGDVMLDRYYWGSVHRISPEAPVPVVEVESEQVRLGGAANVANNIQALGGVPLLIGLVGDDHPGEILQQMMRERGFPLSGMVVDPQRQTTIKTRVIAQGQHIVRVDNETKAPCSAPLADRIVGAVLERIDEVDAVLFEDYNKGVISLQVLRALTALARTHGKIVTVDPKFDNFLEYKGVTVFKPNRREAEEILGGRLSTRREIEEAGARLLALLSAENVLLTRGAEGMSLFEANGSIFHLPTAADNVQDVSGAGDTVIATLTIALSAGATVREACVLANCAGGVVVRSVGIVPIEPQALRDAVLRFSAKPEVTA